VNDFRVIERRYGCQ